MKITEIDYIISPYKNGEVIVTGIRNAATRGEIEKEFGEWAMQRYRQGVYYYGMSLSKGYIVYVRKGRYDRRSQLLGKLKVNQSYSRERFSEIISYMKEAAERLIRIRKHPKPKTKTIRI
jgi:hypothetical protein